MFEFVEDSVDSSKLAGNFLLRDVARDLKLYARTTLNLAKITSYGPRSRWQVGRRSPSISPEGSVRG
jgi:hypothetical protein